MLNLAFWKKSTTLYNAICEYKTKKWLQFAPSALLILSLMFEDLPSCCYRALGLIATGYAVYAVWWLEKKKKERTATKELLMYGLKFQYALSFVAVAFNPIMPFGMGKEKWQVLNIVAAFVLGVFAVLKIRAEKNMKEKRQAK